MNPAFHIIAVSLLTGAFALAVLFFFMRVWAGPNPGPDREAIAKAADFGLLVSAGVGLALSLIAIVTGAFIWPWEAVMNSPLVKNKLTIVIIMTLIWGMFLYLRVRRGTALWQNPILRIYGGVLVVGGFFTNMVANSIGGDIAGSASGFERIVRLFGIETRFSFYLPTWAIAIIFLLAVVAVVLAVVIDRTATPEPEPRAAQ
jgi:hypothetical protein